MDLKRNRSGCKLDGRRYSHGEDAARGGELLECIDGKWVSVVLVSGI